MKLTTIYLSEETENQLQMMAANTGKSISELVQKLVMSQVSLATKPLPKSVGMGASGRSDLSVKAEELLWIEE
jgi:hypothetical protein